MTMNRFEHAAVCGRFQPPHNEHLDFILRATSQCDFLWIGVTQFLVTQLVHTDVAPHRGMVANNPLTYFERSVILSEMLVDAGVSRSRFCCTPFPIECPEQLEDFLPTSIPLLTTICDDWSLAKNNILRASGYEVHVLTERDTKIAEGAAIRRSIAAGESGWIQQVPAATRRAIERFGVRERLLGGWNHATEDNSDSNWY